MATTLNHDDSITVTAYSLPEFTFEIAYLGSKGFTPSMLNSHCPTGGMGSTYQAILVPLTSHYIRLDGTHMNLPEKESKTPNETAIKDDSSGVSVIGATDVPEPSTETPVNETTGNVKQSNTEQVVKQASTRAKKTV